MMKKELLILLCVVLGSCVSEQEQREAGYRYEQTMRNQCEHTLGFKTGTQGYMDCRLFYDKVFKYSSISTTGLSFRAAQGIQDRVDSTNHFCQTYWGTSDMPQSILWKCIKEHEQEAIDEAIRQRDLKEKEEMMTRAISAGQKEANADNRLQERIDAERERVAKEKGKNPKNVKCKTSQKSNGYIQVKCK